LRFKESEIKRQLRVIKDFKDLPDIDSNSLERAPSVMRGLPSISRCVKDFRSLNVARSLSDSQEAPLAINTESRPSD
jgi:hypothetical protein